MSITDDIIEGIKRLAKSRYGTVAGMCREKGLSQSKISKFLRKKIGIRSDSLAEILEALGARIVFPDQEEADGQGVRVLKCCEAGATCSKCLDVQKYISVPEYPFDKPETFLRPKAEDILNHYVVTKTEHVGFREKLIAIRVPIDFVDMSPTIVPGDLMIVDPDDMKNSYAPPGNIFVVKTISGQISVRRVILQSLAHGNKLLTYADNSQKVAPEYHFISPNASIDELKKELLGRVILIVRRLQLA